MRSKLNRLMIAALVLNYSCVSSDEPAPELVASEVAESRQAIVDTAPASYWPVPGLASASGFQKTWDGSTAELLAADALVSCWSSLPQAIRAPGDHSYNSSFVLAIGFGDPVMSAIISKMSTAICPAHRTQISNPFVQRTAELFNDWIAARNDPACSFDPANGKGRALDLHSTRSSLAAAAWTPPTDTSVPARREAEAELAYADLYLCMTERLVEHTQSSFIFQAGDEEVLRLYDLARNRALLSVFQYSLLAKVFAADGTALSGIGASQYGTLAALKDWATQRTSKEQTAAGKDLALAVDTLTELTQRQVELLHRDASRGASSKWGADGRAQILATLKDSLCLDAREEKLEESGQRIAAAVHDLRQRQA